MPPKQRYQASLPVKQSIRRPEPEHSTVDEDSVEDGDDEILSSIDGDLDEELEQLEAEDVPMSNAQNFTNPAELPNRKRKRKAQEQDLEGEYMSKLAREEAKDDEKRRSKSQLKRQKLTLDQDSTSRTDASEDDADADADAEDNDLSQAREAVPVHETLAADDSPPTDLEKATRTIFLANVCTSAITSKAAKKTLLNHLGSFFSEIDPPLPGKPDHKLESLRFRSTAYAGGGLPKKAAYAKKDLMATTTKSTNAYAIYSTAYAAREATKRLNGTIVLERHLRADGVAHPTKIDHRRCVFVGNLGFVDDESLMDREGETARKRGKVPSDIEEGLWRHFGKAGKVESVRVVRDEKTRVGKGFAYVQFEVRLPLFTDIYPQAYKCRILMLLKPRFFTMIRSSHLCFRASFASFEPRRFVRLHWHNLPVRRIQSPNGCRKPNHPRATIPSPMPNRCQCKAGPRTFLVKLVLDIFASAPRARTLRFSANKRIPIKTIAACHFGLRKILSSRAIEPHQRRGDPRI